MDAKEWIYKSNEKEMGPVSEGEIKNLIANHSIDPRTPISKAGSGIWKPLEEEPVFMHSDIDEKEPVIREKDIDSEHLSQQDLSFDYPHPWHRFWARILDYLIFGFIVTNIIGLFLSVKFISPPVITMGLIFFWVFLEALFISFWNTTPGKWLFNIKIEKKDGSPITYIEALARGFSVWWLGLAAGLPVIYIVTLIVACVKLSNNRVTSWDKKGDFVVKHRKMSWWRIIVVVMLYVLFGYLLFLINIELIEYGKAVSSKIMI